MRSIGIEVSPGPCDPVAIRPTQGIPMGSEDYTVYVVDDDARMCEAW